MGGFFGDAPLWFSIPFVSIFVLAIGSIVYAIIKGMAERAKNNASEVLTVPVKLIAKRTEVWGGSGDSRARTSYYLTFEAQNGDRKEMEVTGEQYGLSMEGDEGMLTFQGTRFKKFERSMQA
ncbi:DUF2500 domain-containing protein [Saccharibacillus sp. VR-M41]|uniref:DUF2500 domain-containing protein n=2 Tax=Saccharibacillus alkalitolerans TaxID=2705290 RepID=A0ABX0F586_9BACL|nr:DUF2500 domain-containing protein [Saccharibacillus alkalitolerans]